MSLPENNESVKSRRVEPIEVILAVLAIVAALMAWKTCTSLMEKEERDMARTERFYSLAEQVDVAIARDWQVRQAQAGSTQDRAVVAWLAQRVKEAGCDVARSVPRYDELPRQEAVRLMTQQTRERIQACALIELGASMAKNNAAPELAALVARIEGEDPTSGPVVALRTGNAGR